MSAALPPLGRLTEPRAAAAFASGVHSHLEWCRWCRYARNVVVNGAVLCPECDSHGLHAARRNA